MLQDRIGRLFPGSIAGTLILLLLAILVPILLVEAGIYYRASERFEERRVRELQANLEVAHSVARGFDTYIRGILLQELIVGSALSSPYPPFSGQISQLLAACMRESPSLRSLSWIDPQGRVLISSPPDADSKLRCSNCSNEQVLNARVLPFVCRRSRRSVRPTNMAIPR